MRYYKQDQKFETVGVASMTKCGENVSRNCLELFDKAKSHNFYDENPFYDIDSRANLICLFDKNRIYEEAFMMVLV